MKILYTFIFLAFSLGSVAQQIPDYGIHKIRITDSDRIVVAEIFPVSSAFKPRTDREYHWFQANRIQHLQGGFSGKLLNGTYTEFYPNKNIREEGTYKNGLKDKTWKFWTENGVLTKVTTWNDGVLSGKFMLFKADGTLEESGRYAESKLNGPVIFYEQPDSSRTVYYKKGKIVPHSNRSFLQRINIFKKKQTGPNQ
jgi:hypothetical protein